MQKTLCKKHPHERLIVYYHAFNTNNKIYTKMEKETFLTFVLGKELFAVNVKNVLEVLEQQQITRVPKAPEHIMGIINFRGEILPVVNTRNKFNLIETEGLLKNYVIVYIIGDNEKQYTIAATADGVKDVIEIAQEDIKPVPEMGISYDARFIVGAIKINEKFILLINPEKVFSITDTEVVTQTEMPLNL
jgi:purine-binding chemotaxis protein CheW